uniref:Uncharacterized protein orf77 n=1 Tax=Nyctotherus ovalis TaxID=70075 RepID=F1AAI8_NYCOV|nr:hypothetical protein [Nyctotherus ovalis]
MIAPLTGVFSIFTYTGCMQSTKGVTTAIAGRLLDLISQHGIQVKNIHRNTCVDYFSEHPTAPQSQKLVSSGDSIKNY